MKSHCTSAALWLAVFAALGSGFNEKMIEHPLNKMTRVNGEDQVTVYQYESPLEEEQFGRKLGLLRLFHTSLGAVLPSGLNVTMEFAANDFPSVFLPSVTPEGKVVWNNTASVHAKQGILDDRYWTRRYLLGTVSGVEYNALLDWVEKHQQERYGAYFLWRLQTGATHGFKSITCDDFVFDLVKQLPLAVNISGDSEQFHAAAGTVEVVKPLIRSRDGS